MRLYAPVILRTARVRSGARLAIVRAIDRATPKLQDYLNVTSFLYWQEANVGLGPTLRINHVVIHPNSSGGFNIASKQPYASHYFWTALETRVLVNDPTGPVASTSPASPAAAPMDCRAWSAG